MPLMTILLTLIVVGVVLYLINRYIPLQPPIPTILNAVVIIFLVIWLLKELGLWTYLFNVRL